MNFGDRKNQNRIIGAVGESGFLAILRKLRFLPISAMQTADISSFIHNNVKPKYGKLRDNLGSGR